MSLTREEKCRVLAEWLEPFTVPFHNKTGAWIVKPTHDEEHWAKPADFYTSEEASALLLDKMLVLDTECYDIVRTLFNDLLHIKLDRKTAIAEAAYQFCTRKL